MGLNNKRVDLIETGIMGFIIVFVLLALSAIGCGSRQKVKEPESSAFKTKVKYVRDSAKRHIKETRDNVKKKIKKTQEKVKAFIKFGETNFHDEKKQKGNYIIKSWAEDRECLWNIAKREYGDPWRYHELYAINIDSIGNDPNLIIEGNSLFIP